MILPNGADAVEGIVEEVDPPRRLVVTWHVLYDPEMADEPASRVEWLIAPSADGVTRVTTIHRDLALSPRTSEEVGYGRTWVLDSMKSFLETGEPLPGDPLDPTGDEATNRRRRGRGPPPRCDRRQQLDVGAARPRRPVGRRGGRHARPCLHGSAPLAASGTTWTGERGAGVVAVVAGSRLARTRRRRAPSRRPLRAARRRRRVDRLRSRLRPRGRRGALACVGRLDEAAVELAAAREVPIADDDDRSIVESDLRTEPWYGLVVSVAT